jgi:hypothetical protein
MGTERVAARPFQRTRTTVNNVWEIRYRLLLEHFAELASQLRGEKTITPAELEEQVTRLLACAVMLLHQHRVNKRGQCRYCGWTTWIRRFSHRRPQCTVYRSLYYTTGQRIETVRQQLDER